MTPRQILTGPHLREIIDDEGVPMLMVQPLQAFRVMPPSRRPSGRAHLVVYAHGDAIGRAA